MSDWFVFYSSIPNRLCRLHTRTHTHTRRCTYSGNPAPQNTPCGQQRQQVAQKGTVGAGLQAASLEEYEGHPSISVFRRVVDTAIRTSHTHNCDTRWRNRAAVEETDNTNYSHQRAVLIPAHSHLGSLRSSLSNGEHLWCDVSLTSPTSLSGKPLHQGSGRKNSGPGPG